MKQFVDLVSGVLTEKPETVVFLASLLLMAVVLVILFLRTKRETAKERKLLAEMKAELALQAERAEEKNEEQRKSVEKAFEEIGESLRQMTTDIQRTQQGQLDAIGGQIRAANDERDRKTSELMDLVDGRVQSVEKILTTFDDRMNDQAVRNEQQMLSVCNSVSDSLREMEQRQQNALAEMGNSLAGQIEGVMDRKLDPSLSGVAGRLDQVTEGLREITKIAERGQNGAALLPGIHSSAELGTILAQMLSPSQYAANVNIKPGTEATADYAVVMPGQNGRTVLLPIDAGLPMREYEELCKVCESGTAAEVAAARSLLESSVRMHARRISEKLIAVPYTTDYAILFLPGEGLYAEVLRVSGLVETVQRESHMVIAGPTTFSALISSLQLGFHSLAIEQQTAKVEEMLCAVRSEIDRYSAALGRTQNRLRQAAMEIETVQRHGDSIKRHLTDLPEIAGDSVRMIRREIQSLDSSENGDDVWD